MSSKGKGESDKRAPEGGGYPENLMDATVLGNISEHIHNDGDHQHQDRDNPKEAQITELFQVVKPHVEPEEASDNQGAICYAELRPGQVDDVLEKARAQDQKDGRHSNQSQVKLKENEKEML